MFFMLLELVRLLINLTFSKKGLVSKLVCNLRKWDLTSAKRVG